MPGSQGSRPQIEAAIQPLLKDEARCRALLAATDAIVWTTSADGRFVEPQHSWQGYTGQSWQESQGDGWHRAVHPDDVANVVHAWSLARARKDQYHASCRIWHAESGAHRFCVIRASAIKDAQGRIVEWIGAVTDVHDRPMSLQESHRLNDALKQQLEAYHEELERFFSVSLDVMLSIGTDGRLITVSPSFEAVTGYAPSEAQGDVFEKFLHPDDLAKTWAEIRQVLTGTYNAVDFETRVIRRDGQQRVVSWRAVGTAGEARLYAVGRDVTEKKAEVERLLRAQRLEAVGQLTGGIAHDFNNILAALMSYVEAAKHLLQREPARLPGLLDSALDAGRRGARLVQQLLTFARKQQLSIGPVDLNELVRDMKEMVERTLGGKIAVQLSCDEGIRAALADRTQLESVMLNLCINARDAMPDGGDLFIRTSRLQVTDDPASRVDDLPRGDYAVLSVIDTGTGMDEATLARCVEPFFTTKEPGKGSGLGLSQVVGFVHQCGGTVRIDSKPGQGTAIDVILPKIAAIDAAAANDEGPPSPPSLAAGTVLLVDDDPDVLSSTAQLLEALGYGVIAAASAEEAMSIVLGGRPFDVLVTDFAMPKMNGADLIRDAQQHRRKITAIMVSGYSDFEAMREQLPGVTVLRKPVELSQLLQAVETAIHAHRTDTGEHAHGVGDA